MSHGDKDAAKRNELDGLEEATAGFDPYLSNLLNSDRAESPREERRRAPRDATPARRRSILASGADESDEEEQAG